MGIRDVIVHEDARLPHDEGTLPQGHVHDTPRSFDLDAAFGAQRKLEELIKVGIEPLNHVLCAPRDNGDTIHTLERVRPSLAGLFRDEHFRQLIGHRLSLGIAPGTDGLDPRFALRPVHIPLVPFRHFRRDLHLSTLHIRDVGHRAHFSRTAFDTAFVLVNLGPLLFVQRSGPDRPRLIARGA